MLFPSFSAAFAVSFRQNFIIFGGFSNFLLLQYVQVQPWGPAGGVWGGGGRLLAVLTNSRKNQNNFLICSLSHLILTSSSYLQQVPKKTTFARQKHKKQIALEHHHLIPILKLLNEHVPWLPATSYLDS
jgi:hypothetical protein